MKTKIDIGLLKRDLQGLMSLTIGTPKITELIEELDRIKKYLLTKK